MPEDDVGSTETGPGWRAGAVAARLGVAASTLRSWNQRYDLGPSDHRSGRHRRYTAADVACLEHMRSLVAAGVTPAEAARWARGHPGSQPCPVPGPIPRSAVTNLLAAAQRLENAALASALRRHLDEHGVIATWDQLCRPVLTELSRGHLDHGGCIDAEHLLSWTISSVFHQVSGIGRAPGSRTALLTCSADERHTLPLEALRAALAERGTPAHMMGADLPTGALVSALARLRPDVLVIWAHTGATARVPHLSDSPHLPDPPGSRHRPGLVIAAGPGWRADRLTTPMQPVDSLRAAVDLIHPANTAENGE